MPDEDNQPAAQNETVVTDDNQDATPAAEPTSQPADEGDGEQSPESSSPEATPKDEPKKPSRAERRIQQLSDKVKQVEQGTNQPAPQGPPSPQFDVRQYADPEGNVDERRINEAYGQNVVQTASAIANLEVQRQLNHQRAVDYFDRDSESLPTQYEELNENSDAYTPELDESIAQEYQEKAFKVVGYDQQGRPITQLDPSVRLADIAKRQINSARAYAQRVSARSNAGQERAADEAAPRPTGDRPADKPFEQLSREEMKARLGYHKQ